MFNKRHMILAGAALSVAIVLIGGLFIWPNYRKASGIRRQIAELEQKTASLQGRAHEVAQLSDQVHALREQMERELKTIPTSPDVAGLFDKLTQKVDHETVLDQAFTAGTPCEALAGASNAAAAGSTMRIIPITVDMEGAFDSIFALLRSAETVRRLVRVGSVRLQCNHDSARPSEERSALAGQAVVKASIRLEAVYESSGEEAKP